MISTCAKRSPTAVALAELKAISCRRREHTAGASATRERDVAAWSRRKGAERLQNLEYLDWLRKVMISTQDLIDNAWIGGPQDIARRTDG